MIGAWRSLVAHLFWVQGVVGSNPAAPTTKKRGCPVWRPIFRFNGRAKCWCRAGDGFQQSSDVDHTGAVPPGSSAFPDVLFDSFAVGFDGFK